MKFALLQTLSNGPNGGVKKIKEMNDCNRRGKPKMRRSAVTTFQAIQTRKNMRCTNTQDLNLFIDGDAKMISHRKRARKRQENNKNEN